MHHSCNHDAPSNCFIFTPCSKYTWALVQSYLIGWGLIWFRWCCDRPMLHTVGVWLSLWFRHRHFSQLLVMVSDCKWGGNCCDLFGSNPQELISYKGWEEVFMCRSIDASVLCLGPADHSKSSSPCVFIYLLSSASDSPVWFFSGAALSILMYSGVVAAFTE